MFACKSRFASSALFSHIPTRLSSRVPFSQYSSHASYNATKAARSQAIMSVLGKRLRSTRQNAVIDSTAHHVDILPPRKRSKRSLPLIHEDADTATTTRPQASRRPFKTGQSRKQYQTQWQQVKVADEDVELLDSSLDASEQDENLPPTETLLQTPSRLRFKNALADGLLTPKQKVRVVGGLLTPKTPTSRSVIREQNIYARARQLFTSSSAPAKLIGRDSERKQLHDFVEAARSKSGGQCIYISGPPGTGKSALVQEALQQHSDDQEIRISMINCVGLRTAAQVYGKLMEDLAPEMNTGKMSGEQHLRKLFTATPGDTAYVVMLDEVDSLVESECETLYNLFEWSLKSGSNLSLIGVANSLDLTDRFLPRLKSKGLKPRLLPFLPYNAQQIAQIISDKLRTLLPEHSSVPAAFTPCIHPAAIQLCAKKIASQTGDLRKAFSLVRQSLDQIEKDAGKQATPTKTPLGEITNPVQLLEAQLKTKVPTLSAENAPRASIAHVAKLASNIFNQGTISRLSGLNLQQKAVLCSVVNKEVRRQARNPFITPTKSANKAPSVAELFQKYTSLCKRDDGLLQPLKDTEFRDVVASLETLGLVHESKARSSSLLTPTSSSRSGRNHDERQIVSAVTDKELRASLNGPGADLLRRLLEEL